MAELPENKLHLSWSDSVWIPMLNQENILDYFSQRSNPFYDRTCNNEIVRMQNANPAQLVNMMGIEYSVLLVQEPILYVIRKVNRQSPDKVIPLADYYILDGIVYQCPDLRSIINSRLLSTLHNVHQAFDEALSYARYDPSRGYYWKFPGDTGMAKVSESTRKKDEPQESQKKRVDGLLMELVKHYPPKVVQSKDGGKPAGMEMGSQDKPDKAETGGASGTGGKRVAPPSNTGTAETNTSEPKRKKPLQI